MKNVRTSGPRHHRQSQKTRGARSEARQDIPISFARPVTLSSSCCARQMITHVLNHQDDKLLDGWETSYQQSSPRETRQELVFREFRANSLRRFSETSCHRTSHPPAAIFHGALDDRNDVSVTLGVQLLGEDQEKVRETRETFLQEIRTSKSQDVIHIA